MGVLLVVLVVLGIVAAGALLYFVTIYNGLVQIRVNVDKSWSNIDVLEKQRFDEIPKLVTVCEGYMRHERETLTRVTDARTKFLEAKGPAQVAQADSALAGALKTLFAVSENYPDLKANASFRQLQERISYLENQIADRREFYNDSVSVFNTRIQQIPDVAVANLLAMRPKEMYKVPEEEKKPPEIKFQFPQ